YAAALKSSLLGVDADTIEKCGVVSEECAREMAAGCKAATGADISVSVTGIAGPLGGTPETPVGTVCFGVADKNGSYTETKSFSSKSDRAKIRRLATAHAIMLALKRLRGEI
ncbi:MAG: nicotinamide-nucleotide amidohydrolase family protein, partial [Clostridia bacterium]|nr:nicotinamide-nucleotide amidohydrolase family protein [Clostridia bacterium]